jgi:hypothetical protein
MGVDQIASHDRFRTMIRYSKGWMCIVSDQHDIVRRERHHILPTLGSSQSLVMKANKNACYPNGSATIAKPMSTYA